MKRSNLFISFVIPMFNEERCIKELYLRLLKICRQLKAKSELICVDDGSTDLTLSILKKLRKKDPQVKVISFTRNFGHQIAVMAGLKYVSGDCAVVMDADLQDPPEVVPKMVKKWSQGYKVVYGVRGNREEKWLMTTCYKLFYRFLLKVSLLKDIPLDAGDFCLIDKRVVQQMRRFGEERPFVRGLRAWVGFRQTGVKYKRPSRSAGRSKYSFGKLLRLAFDGLFSFSTIALRVTVFVGLLISLLSIVYAFYIGINRILIIFKMISSEKLIPGWATLVCSIMFLMGLQFVFLGILGEYIGRIYSAVKRRPLFIIEEKLGLKDEETKN